MEKIILDVDTGVDDAMAIILALESKKFDMLGITTVNGNVSLNHVKDNTRRVLQLIGRTDVKVYAGAKEPYVREAVNSEYVHGKDGLGHSLEDMEITMEIEDTFAPDFMIEAVKKHPGEVTLVCVGPLTNLALAIKKDASFLKDVKRVVIMGGSVKDAGMGNVSAAAEFNIFADAEAAKIVFHQGLDLTMVSLDVSDYTFIEESHLEELRGTKYYKFIEKATRVAMEHGENITGKRATQLHDPLTVGYLLDPSYIELRDAYVDVETKGEITYGQTLADYHNKTGKTPNVKVCVSADSERFVRDFVDLLKACK